MVPLTVYLPGGILLFWISREISHRWSLRRKAKAFGCESITNYPHLDPIGGLDLSVQIWREFHRGELSEGMRRRHEKFGPTFSTNSLGQDCIYTIDPENIRAVTTDNFDCYGKSAWVEEAAKHVGNGILMSDGENWKRSRAVLKPLFARTALDEPTLVEPHLQDLVQVIRGNNGQPFDFQVLAARFTLDIVTDFLFGKSTQSLLGGKAAEDARHFLGLVKDFEPPSGTFIAVGALAWLELLPSYRRLLHVVDGMKAFFRSQLDMIISDPGLHSQSAAPSCFRMMESDGVGVGQIQAELQNIFFASFDTTTALLANIIGILSQRQDIQQQLRAEISYLNGNPPTKQDLGGLSFLRFVLLEALRLYSPVVSHSRQATRDTTLPRGGGSDGLGQIFVAAGATIVWSTYALNRSQRYYGQTWAEFKPERWKTLQPTSNRFFMPFGSGPRSCMGQQMAQTEISYMIVRILQEFPVIASQDLRPFKEAKAVSFYNTYGTKISMY